MNIYWNIFSSFFLPYYDSASITISGLSLKNWKLYTFILTVNLALFVILIILIIYGIFLELLTLVKIKFFFIFIQKL